VGILLLKILEKCQPLDWPFTVGCGGHKTAWSNYWHLVGYEASVAIMKHVELCSRTCKSKD